MMRGRGRPRRAAVPLILVATAMAVVVSAVIARSPAPAPVSARAPALPEPVEPAFRVGTPQPLSGERYRAQWAAVRRPVVARAAPSSSAAAVSALPATTPEGTRNVVAVIGHRQDRAGRAWVQVRLAVLPNGTTGWLPRTALGGYGIAVTRLVIDLRRLRATLYRGDRAVEQAPVGAGAPGWPTPRGDFYIRDKLENYQSAAYGPVAFGTSARSAHATDWPAGGYVGIHGTDQPALIPGRVSHGCIRMRNADILAMAKHMGVGTPVTIR
jgi:lipoprotein-anchoring transpeptidase ErfK/SrfK